MLLSSSHQPVISFSCNHGPALGDGDGEEQVGVRQTVPPLFISNGICWRTVCRSWLSTRVGDEVSVRMTLKQPYKGSWAWFTFFLYQLPFTLGHSRAGILHSEVCRGT